MTQDFSARIQKLVDRDDIWAVLLRYARGIDRLDQELVLSCYWDDAVDDHHAFVGRPDAFAAWAFDFNINNCDAHHHGLGNHYCEIDGDDAHCETYFTFIGSHLEPPHLMSIGRYVDHFQRRDGVWKIANRVTVIEKNYSLSEHPHDAVIRAGDTSFGPLLHASRDKADLSYSRPVVPRRP